MVSITEPCRREKKLGRKRENIVVPHLLMHAVYDEGCAPLNAEKSAGTGPLKGKAVSSGKVHLIEITCGNVLLDGLDFPAILWLRKD